MVIFTTNYVLMEWYNLGGLIQSGGLVSLNLPYELVTTGQDSDGITQVMVNK